MQPFHGSIRGEAFAKSFEIVHVYNIIISVAIIALFQPKLYRFQLSIVAEGGGAFLGPIDGADEIIFFPANLNMGGCWEIAFELTQGLNIQLEPNLFW